jgi:hypothetical protein
MTFDPLLAFFALGFLARVVGSDLRLPGPLYESLTILLLLSIGLKGGVELAEQELTTLWLPVLAVAAMGVLLTFIAYAALRGFVRVARVDAAAIAAHYGSVSVGTFAVASAVLAERSYPLEPYLPLLVVVLEVPAIVVGIALARGMGGGAPIRPVLGEIVTSKSIVLLVGGLAVGWIAGRDGLEPVAPVFMSGFKGALALFLLEMGVVCGERVGSLRHAGVRLAFFAVVMPCVGGVIGAAVGTALGLGIGGTACLATLAASASYIAVPAAMRIAVPSASPALSLTASLGVTFPFNVTVGIPLYLHVARWMHHVLRG